MKTVVLGGYGNFGARICRALANSEGIELVVAARNGARAMQFAAVGVGSDWMSSRPDSRAGAWRPIWSDKR